MFEPFLPNPVKWGPCKQPSAISIAPRLPDHCGTSQTTLAKVRIEGCGEDPGGDQRCRRCVRSDSSGGEQGGVCLGAESVDFDCEFFDLCSECLIGSSQQSEGLFGVGCGGGGCARSERSAGLDAGLEGRTAELVSM